MRRSTRQRHAPQLLPARVRLDTSSAVRAPLWGATGRAQHEGRKSAAVQKDDRLPPGLQGVAQRVGQIAQAVQGHAAGCLKRAAQVGSKAGPVLAVVAEEVLPLNYQVALCQVR